MVLDELKAYKTERYYTTEQIVEVLAFACLCREKWVAVGGSTPAWVDSQIAVIEADLAKRVADEQARTVAHLEAELESLSTAEEKREKLRRRIAELTGKKDVTG